MSEPTDRSLIVLLNGTRIGTLDQNQHGQLSFTYDERYRTALRNATPLSLSMPLAQRTHGNKVVEPYLRGLLPDNENVLRRWGARYGVPWNSPFAQLRTVGEDVAGAVQFVRESRLGEVTEPGSIEPKDETYIANRLRVLRDDRAAWDDIDSPGQFSLAGAQAKFALYRSPDGQWGLPAGRNATTHIFKPALEHLAHQEVNEHLCLRAAERLGMRVAHSRVMQFGEEHAIVLARYDRVVNDDGSVTRVHQEDICQALAVYPARKYEREDGGPGPVTIIDMLRENISPNRAARSAIQTFCQALAYNWVIFGPDAHAKNYSLLLSGSTVRLAPLYDISSVAAYPDRYDLRTMAMAMAVNGKYENRLVTGDDWRALANSVGVDPDEMTGWVHHIVSNTPDALVDAARHEQDWVSRLPMTHVLIEGVAANSKQLLRWVEPPAEAGPHTASVSRRPGKPRIEPYRKADGAWVSGYDNPRYRG
jgi:serine/threonine-protein kinase HipA